jgi:hypothetical protein
MPAEEKIHVAAGTVSLLAMRSGDRRRTCDDDCDPPVRAGPIDRDEPTAVMHRPETTPAAKCGRSRWNRSSKPESANQ